MTDELTAGIEVAPDKLGEALLALRLTSSSGRGGGSTRGARAVGLVSFSPALPLAGDARARIATIEAAQRVAIMRVRLQVRSVAPHHARRQALAAGLVEAAALTCPRPIP